MEFYSHLSALLPEVHVFIVLFIEIVKLNESVDVIMVMIMLWLSLHFIPRLWSDFIISAVVENQISIQLC